jgi:hypothetical protein
LLIIAQAPSKKDIIKTNESHKHSVSLNPKHNPLLKKANVPAIRINCITEVKENTENQKMEFRKDEEAGRILLGLAFATR